MGGAAADVGAVPTPKQGRLPSLTPRWAVAVFSWVSSFCATFIMKTVSLDPKKAATCSAKAVRGPILASFLGVWAPGKEEGVGSQEVGCLLRT